jgi:hypothetical protein
MPSRSRDSGISICDETSCWCVFLCDNDGHVTHQFGVLKRKGSSESIPTRSLIGLIESARLVEFLETVRACGVTRGWEMRIRLEETSLKVLLHGFQTPQGILVFAPLPPQAVTLKPGRSNGVMNSGAGENEEDALSLFEVAHNLHNPISSIVSACEYLTNYSQENLNTEQKEMIAGIESAAETLLQISRRLFERSNGKSRSTATARRE